MPLYLNYTHVNIIERIEEFLTGIGNVEHIQGEVYVCKQKPDLNLDELDEAEMRLLKVSDVKSIHDLYPASEIESIEVFEKLAGSLPGMSNLLQSSTISDLSDSRLYMEK